MQHLVPLLACLGLLCWAIQRIVNARLRRQHAKRLGCEEPWRRPHKLPFGVDFVRDMMRADRENRLPSQFFDIYRDNGYRATWKQYLLTADQILTVDPENVKALLATQFKDFDLGPNRKGGFSPIFANGIFSDDGARWEHSRALIRPQFVRDQIADAKHLEDHVANLVRVLTSGVDASGWTPQKDLSPLFFRQTLDSSTEFLFGRSVGSQLAGLADEKNDMPITQEDREWLKFGPAFDAATMEIARRVRLGGLYFLHNTKALRDACKEVHRFSDHFVRLALEPHAEKQPADDSRQPYVFLHELAKSTRDPIELRDQLLNVLLAGRDTTAGLLGWVFYQLARHPDIYQKLRGIVLEEFGPYDNPAGLDFASLKSCVYLQHVLNEGLRLHPSVPLNVRCATRDTTLPRGGGADGKSPIFVAKGTDVGYTVQVMQRRPDLWGPDADRFNPDRWIGRRPGWEFLPFNGGPRICLGQQFALTTAGYTVVRLCQKFDQLADLVPHDPESDTEKYWYSVTGAPIHVKLRLHEAQP